jgi:hypothetical protein
VGLRSAQEEDAGPSGHRGILSHIQISMAVSAHH